MYPTQYELLALWDLGHKYVNHWGGFRLLETALNWKQFRFLGFPS